MSDLQVYTLEKVLMVKKDPVTQVVFLDEAMKVRLESPVASLEFLTSCTLQVLENKPSSTFWGSLGQSLEKQIRDAAKGAVPEIGAWPLC